MALTVTSKCVDQVAEITLIGELDAHTAPRFQEELLKAVEQKPKRLVLFTKDLVYLASAGIRMLIVAKQKMGAVVDVYVVAPSREVIDTLRRTGLMNTVVVVDQYPADS